MVEAAGRRSIERPFVMLRLYYRRLLVRNTAKKHEPTALDQLSFVNRKWRVGRVVPGTQKINAREIRPGHAEIKLRIRTLPGHKTDRRCSSPEVRISSPGRAWQYRCEEISSIAQQVSHIERFLRGRPRAALHPPFLAAADQCSPARRIGAVSVRAQSVAVAADEISHCCRWRAQDRTQTPPRR